MSHVTLVNIREIREAHCTKALEHRQWILFSSSSSWDESLLLKKISATTVTLLVSSIMTISSLILKHTAARAHRLATDWWLLTPVSRSQAHFNVALTFRRNFHVPLARTTLTLPVQSFWIKALLLWDKLYFCTLKETTEQQIRKLTLWHVYYGWISIMNKNHGSLSNSTIPCLRMNDDMSHTLLIS